MGEATESFAAIRDAMASGDMETAMKILGLSLKVQWKRAMAFMMKSWVGFKQFFLEKWNEAVFGLSMAFVNSWADIQTAWVKTVMFMLDIWQGAVTKIAEGIAWMMEDLGMAPEGTIAAVGEDSGRAQQARDQFRDQALANIATKRDDQLLTLAEDEKREQDAIRNQFAGSLDQSQKELADARAQLAAAITAAKKETGEDDGASLAPDLKASFNIAQGKLASAAVSTDNERNKLESVGGFSAAAIGQIGALSLASRTAKATEAMGSDIKRMLSMMQGGLPVQVEAG